MAQKDVRDQVREGYAKIVKLGAPDTGCCAGEKRSACCGGGGNANDVATKLGYTAEDLASLPEGANLGLSCGNPIALASLSPGEVVLDLGAGAGFDVLIAARKVAPTGRAIGVDMTPEMISRARANAAKLGLSNVEFRLGEIESLPAADESVDVVISNCVINLSTEKGRVFREIARVLKPGGRVAVSDMALLRPLPEPVRADVQAWIGCVAGAVMIDEYVGQMREAGLTEIEVEPVAGLDALEDVKDPLYKRMLEKLPAGTRPLDFVASVRVTARKGRR